MSGGDSRWLPWRFLFVFLMLTLAIGIMARLDIENEQASMQQSQEDQLAAVANLKVSQLANWRRERIASAQTLSDNPWLAQSILEWQANGSQAREAEIMDWMSRLDQVYSHSDVALLDVDGRVILSILPEPQFDRQLTRTWANRAVSARKVFITDIHTQDHGGVELDVVAPIFDPRNRASTPIAVALLELNPDSFLYPLIDFWPSSSVTARIVLAEQAGETQNYLSREHRPDKPKLVLQSNLPVHSSDRDVNSPISAANDGPPGITRGLDERGVPVWAVTRSVPDSPWSIVAEMDTEEIMAPITARVNWLWFVSAVLVLTTGAATGFAWRNQRSAHFRAQYRTELERRSLAYQLEYLTRYANDAIILVNEQGRVVQVNERAIFAYGYSRAELLQMNLRDLTADETRALVDSQLQEVERRNGLVFESVHRRRDGTHFPVEISIGAIGIDGTKYLQSIIRDITERKQSEQELRKSRALLNAIVEGTPDSIYVKDLQGRYLLFNAAFAAFTGKSAGQVIGHDDTVLFPPAQARTVMEADREVIRTGQTRTWEERAEAADGTSRVFLSTQGPLLDDQGVVLGLFGIARNITARKRAEEALRASEERFRSVVENATDLFVLVNADGSIRYVSPSVKRTLGYRMDDEARLNIFGYIHPQDLPRAMSALAYRLEFPETAAGIIEVRVRCADGSWRDLEGRGDNLLANPQVEAIVLVFRDITERKRAEQQVADALHYLQTMLEASPVSIITYKASGPVISANQASARLVGATLDQVMGQNFRELDSWQESGLYSLAEQALETWSEVEGETFVRTTFGRSVWLSSRIVPFQYQGEPHLLLVSEDITERRQAEQALRESERRFRDALENVQLISVAFDNAGHVTFCNDFLLHLAGWTRDELMGQDWFDNLLPPEQQSEVRQVFLKTISTGLVPSHYENDILTREGARRTIQWSNTVLKDPQGKTVGIVSFGEDITERKRRERELEAIATMSTALRIAETRAEMLPVIVDHVMALLSVDSAALAFCDSNTGQITVEIARGQMAQATGLNVPPDTSIIGHVIQTRELYVAEDVTLDSRLAYPNLFEHSTSAACAPLVARDRAFGALWAGHNTRISDDKMRLLTAIAGIAANAIHRATLNDETQQHLERLAALRTVDQAISSSLDLKITFGIILNAVQNQLRVDAACVLLLKQQAQVLEYTTGRGFKTNVFERIRPRLGQDYAGRSALERQTIGFRDWHAEIPDRSRIQTLVAGLETEGFAAFYIVPLVIKGQVKGVLEVFHRAPLAPDQEWLDFLHSMAGQTAIAIDNAALFEGLDRANTELVVAYDTTIEGWSRAMDLRDKETEGHSLRVAEKTLVVARAMHVPESELVHIRRGALLHDIGKMGIPDTILHKPGPLSESEWRVMRKHPELAFELLSPIEYLRPALSIPYCHHERWDGAGYPRGLKGEQIPLVARIFAVVDVWDALLSDRPYRTAWSKEKVREYIQSQIGTHFDPRVAEAFLRAMP